MGVTRRGDLTLIMEILLELTSACPTLLLTTYRSEKKNRANIAICKHGKLQLFRDKHNILGVLPSRKMIPSTYTRDGKWVNKTSRLGDQKEQVPDRS